ncbi:MAG: signal peptidase II [Gemmiger sp.]|nr:signal peptidase II [Gemmiger sp.]
MLRKIIILLSAVGLVAVDQLLKLWATASLRPVGSAPLIPHVVELNYVLNDGMAFSLLSGKQAFLTIVTTLALAGILIYLLLKNPPKLEQAAWTLVLGGGIGNLIDRALNGQVVDYINLLFMRFAVFNFADICITVGVGLLLLSLLLEERRNAKNSKNQETNDGNL